MLNFGEIIQTVKGIVEARFDLVKSEIQDEFVGIVSRFVLLTMIGAMSFIVLLFLSMSLAFYLSQFTKTPYMGFLLVALLYLLIVVGLILSRNSSRVQSKIQVTCKEFIFSRNVKNNQIDE